MISACYDEESELLFESGRSLQDLSDKADDDDSESDPKSIDKTRQRNREHAKKTRLRKKAMLESMKNRLLDLQKEASRLQQIFEENNTANILLCLSADVVNFEAIPTLNQPEEYCASLPLDGNLIDQLRHKVRSEAAEYFKSSQSAKITSGEFLYEDYTSSEKCENEEVSHVDNNALWVCKDGTTESDDKHKSHEGDMDIIRKERNRMHAKLTRDRKKLFTSELQHMINNLERQNMMMRNRLKFSNKRPRQDSEGFSDISDDFSSRGSSSPSAQSISLRNLDTVTSKQVSISSSPFNHSQQRVMYYTFGCQ